MTTCPVCMPRVNVMLKHSISTTSIAQWLGISSAIMFSKMPELDWKYKLLEDSLHAFKARMPLFLEDKVIIDPAK